MKFIQHNRSGEFNINYKKFAWMAEGEAPTPPPPSAAKAEVPNPYSDIRKELDSRDKKALPTSVETFENLKAEKISGEKQDEQKDALLKRIDDLVQKIDAFNAGKEGQKYQDYKTSLEGLKRRVLTAEVKFNEALSAIEAKKKGGTARVAQGAAEGGPVSAAQKAEIAKAAQDAMAGIDAEIVKAGEIPQNIEKARNAVQAVKASIDDGTSREAIENAYGDAHEKLIKVENATKKLIPDANNADRISYLKDISTLQDQLYAAMHHGLGPAAHNHYWAEKWKDIQKATGSKPSKPAPFIEPTIEVKNEREEEAKRKQAAETEKPKAEAELLDTDFKKAVSSLNAMKDKTGKYQEIYDTFAAISVRAEGKNEYIRHQCRVFMLVQKINLEEYADAKILFDECKIYFATHPKEKNEGFDAYAKTIEEGLAKTTKAPKLNTKTEAEAKKAAELAEKKAKEDAKKAEDAKRAEEARLAAERKAQEAQAAKESSAKEQLQSAVNEYFDAIHNALSKKIDELVKLDPEKRPESLRTSEAIQAFRDAVEKRFTTMYSKNNLDTTSQADKDDSVDYRKNKGTSRLPEQKALTIFNAIKSQMQREFDAAKNPPAKKAADKTQAPDASPKAKQEAIDKDDKSLADELNKILDGEGGKPGLQARVDTFLKIDPKSSNDVIKARVQTRKELLDQIDVLVGRITQLTFDHELTEAPAELAKVEKKLNGFKKDIATADLNFNKEAPAAKAPAKPAAVPSAQKETDTEKVDEGAVKLRAKTLDNIDNGKLKGKVTREGFQQWMNSTVLYDALNLKPDAPKLDINKSADALLIVNRIKDAQKAFGMKLPANVQGIFGLKTYEKAINYRSAFKNILSTTADAAEPARAVEKDPVKNLETFKGKLSDVLKKYTIGKDQIASLAPSDLKDKNLDEAVKNLDEALAAIKPKRMKLLGILSPVLSTKNELYSAGPMGDTFSLNVFAPKDEMVKHINDQILNFVRTGSMENKGEEIAAAQANKEFKNARRALADGDITINPEGGIIAKEGNDWVDVPLKDLNFATKPKAEAKAPAAPAATPEPAKPADIPAPQVQPKNDTPPPAEPKAETKPETPPEVASGPSLMSEKNWKDNEKTYVNESYEKKNTFYQIQNALAVSKRTGKPAELMSSALFSPVILDKGNAGKYEAIKVTYKGTDATTKLDKVEFSYGDKTFADLKSFIDYIGVHADITSFSKSNNEALKAQATRLAPQKEAIRDISDTMEGKLNALFAKEGKGRDVRGTVIRELKNAFDRSRDNRSPFEINSNHALFGTNIFAMKNAHVMLEYKGENGKDTVLFIQNIDEKTKKPTDKVEVTGGLDAFIAKLTEIAKDNGKFDAEKPATTPTAAVPATPSPLPDAAPEAKDLPEDLGERDIDTSTDPEYKRLDSEAGKIYDTLLKNKKAEPIKDSPQRQPIWKAYMEAEKKIMEYVKETSGTPYYRSMLHVAQAKMGLGDLDGAKSDLRQVATFFNNELQKDPSVAKFADKAAELITKINKYQR